MYRMWRDIATKSSPVRPAAAPAVARKKSCQPSGRYGSISAPMYVDAVSTHGRRGDGQDDLERWRHSAEFLGEPDEKAFRPTDVTEPIRVFVLDHFAADELRAVFAEPGERLVDVVHGEHDAEVAEGVHRGVPVIGDHRRREKARELEPAVAVRRAHHGDLDALVAQSSDAPRPLSFHHRSPFELETELAKELDRRCEVVDDDADVVHSFKCHGPNLHFVVCLCNFLPVRFRLSKCKAPGRITANGPLHRRGPLPRSYRSAKHRSDSEHA